MSQSADDEPRRQPNSGRRLWVVLVAAVLVAILASAAGIFRDFDAEQRDRSSAAVRAGIGALVGIAIAGLIVALVARHRRRKELAAGALGGALLAALAALLVAAGASIGASTAPPVDTSPPRTNQADSDGQGGDGDGETEVQPNSGAIDAETGEMYLDIDGDGRLDVTLVACPPGRQPDQTIDDDPSAPSTTIPPYRVGDKVRVAIDFECDGIIDRYVYLEVHERVHLPGEAPDFPAPGDRPSPDDAGSSDDDSSSSDLGKVLLWLLAFGAIAALVVLVIALARGWRPGRGNKELVELPPPPWPPQEPGIDEQAAADTMAASGRMLLDDPDPRTAIIAAYATLLEGLEAAGAGRLQHEAPEEHLQRSLRKLGIPPAPLSEVTRLFLVARFSTHPVAEADRDAARAALFEAERHLRGVLEARR